MKKIKIYFLTALWAMLCCSCFNNKEKEFTIRITNEGVILSNIPADTTNTYIQVISPNIIRVTKSPVKRIALHPGPMCSWAQDMITVKEQLILHPKKNRLAECVWENEDWCMYWKSDSLKIMTTALKIKVLINTGEIIFYDKNDSLLLREKQGGGCRFSAVSADGYQEYSFRQVFESPDDEAFYGLGQQPSDEFNYKGKNEMLYQYNTKISVPFVVSNKNYGLLWDNCSLTKWGDVRDYANLNQFLLYDKYGQSGSLTATYMDKNHHENVFLERQEKAIDYENLETVKNFPGNLNLSKTYVRWDGYIEPLQSGDYHFSLYYAGYVSVFFDDSLVVAERWRTAWNPNTYKFTLPLKAGKKHKICIKWLPDGGTSYLGLKALSPLPAAEQGQISFSSEMGRQLDYYFIKGNNVDEVISGYRYLTGKAQVMPKWAMGFWQSRERYKTENEIVETLAEFRRRKIPIDNIVLDWSYWPEDQWGSHQFDSTRFPHSQEMVDLIHGMNARLMISVWPKFYVNTEHYKELDAIGAMYPQAVKDGIRDWIGKGYVGSFYDAYHPQGRELYWQQINEHLYTKGIDAWWLDASEPDILSNADMAYRKKLMNPTYLGSSTAFFNAYGLMNARGVYEGQRKTNPKDRVFILTRSGYAGLQRYGAAVWSGDIATRWEDMKAQITAGQNYSISGNPYWTMDNGGFCVEKRYEKAKEGSDDMEEWRELNVRWHQFGAFVPLFRTHGQYPYREIWNIAPESHPAYEAILYYTELRYRLMPYIYTLAGKCYFDDYTIMRPLMMDYGQDKQVLDLGNQYMFGPSMLVCPVYRYKARSRKVYFPEGNGWYDLYSGRYYSGGQTVYVPAPYRRMPVFVAAGSIVPTGEAVQHTHSPQQDLTVYVYAGQDGQFSLYEDEGDNYHYENGHVAWLDFVYRDADRKLTIGARRGEYDNMFYGRLIRIVYVTPDNQGGMDVPVKSTIEVDYVGAEIELAL